MGNSLESYFDFAENDYLFFRQAYDSNVRGSALAALGPVSYTHLFVFPQQTLFFTFMFTFLCFAIYSLS